LLSALPVLLAALLAPAPQGPGANRETPAWKPLRFDHYHDEAEIEAFLRRITARTPGLTKLVEYGRSREGRPLLAVEINNPATGPAAEKPAFYSDGNIHGGEVLGGEGMLYLLQKIVAGYRDDRTLRKLVDTRAFYLVPVVNPDGREISVSTPENHRWNVRPMDEDGDGRMDEDPPEDLDGDGLILRMRVKDPRGKWKVSAEDPRLMVPRAKGETEGTFYRVFSEGLDNDGDGRFNEDIRGGVDLNRNFPSNWSPGQFASGPYPLSEPETRALIEYITSRPNIAAIHTFHTSGGMILRFPTLADQDWEFPAADVADYDAIAGAGVAITLYDNYARDKKSIVDLMHPGHGVFNDWGSKVFGVLAMTTEMWKHPLSGIKELQWNDEVLKGKGFVAWHAFRHPQLGPVELGGWDRWSTASPPPRLMEPELERNARWVLTFAARLPRLVLRRARATRVEGKAGLFDLDAVAANEGWMATATRQAADVLKTARPVTARMELSGASLVEGRKTVSLGILPGARAGRPAREIPLHWRVRLDDPDQPGRAVVVAVSEKGGTQRAFLELPAVRKAVRQR